MQLGRTVAPNSSHKLFNEAAFLVLLVLSQIFSAHFIFPLLFFCVSECILGERICNCEISGPHANNVSVFNLYQ